MGMREVEVADMKLIIHELDQVCDSVTGRALTGSWVWNSALVLSQWMATQSRLELILEGKTVIELGAGLGLPGLTAARLGARRVVLTDVGLLLDGLKRNVEANGLGDRVEVHELAWGSDQSLSGLGESGVFDVVLMSDVFFDVAEMAGLAATLRRVCRGGTTVWAATEVREWTWDCLNELASEGFGVNELLNLSGSLLNSDGGVDLFGVYGLIPPADMCDSRALDEHESFQHHDSRALRSSSKETN